MKYVKTLGLAAVAAAALMAFLGASSASATVLCKTQPTTGGSGTEGTTCPEGWAYPAKTHIHIVNTGTVKLDTSFKTIECTGSTVAGETSNEGSATETVTGPEGTETFTGCNCAITVLKAGTIEVHWIPDTFNGTVTSNGAEITVSCSTIFGNVHCIYVTENESLSDLTGGADAILHTSASIAKKATNSLCSEEGTLTATSTVTEPQPLYIASHT